MTLPTGNHYRPHPPNQVTKPNKAMEQTDKERIEKEAFKRKIQFNLNQDWVVGFKVGATHEHETQVIPLRERLEKVEKENEQLTQWHRDWVSGKWVKEQTANIDRLIKENERLRERLEKVEKALKEARDVLVMASLIDKTSTCMDAVNEIDQLLTKEG